jgi:Phosphotransferase enzyme family
MVVRLRAFVPRSTTLQRPVLVQEFQEGTPADAAWEAMDLAERMRFAEDLGQVVGRVHACSGPWFGDVLGTQRYPDLPSYLHDLVDSRLADAPEDFTSAGRGEVGAALHRAIDAVPADGHPR